MFVNCKFVNNLKYDKFFQKLEAEQKLILSTNKV